MSSLRVAPIALFLATLVCASVASAQSDLQKAYQREFAFLAAEKNSLTQRLAQLETESQQKLNAAKSELDSLQGQVLGLTLEADRLGEQLVDAERLADTAGEGDDVLDSMLTQMGAALEKGDSKFPDRNGDGLAAKIAQLGAGFDLALPLLSKFGTVRKEQGSFFDDAGNKIDGTLIQIGNVASYGVADGAAGALAPAGADRLRIWPGESSADVARSLAAGNAPGQLKIFLYESLEKGIEKKQDKTVVEVIQSGGIIGWVIVGAGLLALLMVILRALFLWRAAANTDKLVDQITPLVEAKRIHEAIEQCKAAKNAAGRVLAATLRHIDWPRDELEDIITESILHEQPHIDRFGSSIIVVAAVAPLLGLLGTVTGMIATFDIITEFGTGNPKLLSGGISIALVTTELGLIVAIPALLFGNLLSGWADRIKDSMDKAALRTVNISTGVRLTTPPPAPRPAEMSEALAAP